MKLFKYIMIISILFLIGINAAPKMSQQTEMEEIVDDNEEYRAIGQTLFKKHYLKYCKNKDSTLNGTKVSKSKTQEDWNESYIEGKFASNFQDMCGIPPAKYNDKHNEYLMHFFWFNAQGSGNVPSCS